MYETTKLKNFAACDNNMTFSEHKMQIYAN